MAELQVKVRRYDPEAGCDSWQEYTVPFEEGMTVLSVLERLYRSDGVAFRHSCDAGLCGICVAQVNGKNRLICKEMVKDPSQPLVIEPPKGFTVVRDLITDWNHRGGSE
ncbi:MAG TPA: 2Fe-2S iron-sulfur cluster binding domain-containing protein [Clostridia bacterium]|nr:2Fe-2S iron-sulfur cluster binding domain-containing protein [Clostridia bacterium]